MSTVRSRTKNVTKESTVKVDDIVKNITGPETVIEAVPSSSKTGQVTVEGGITKNLGDYNSARIGISVSLPCEPSIEGARQAYKEISKLVDQLMNEEYDKVMSTEN